MIAVLDKSVLPGRVVRQVQFTRDEELTIQGSGDHIHAVLETNKGMLECDIGTVAFKADGSVTKWLTVDGWKNFR